MRARIGLRTAQRRSVLCFSRPWQPATHWGRCCQQTEFDSLIFMLSFPKLTLVISGGHSGQMWTRGQQESFVWFWRMQSPFPMAALKAVESLGA